VLLVDDDPDTCELLALHLRGAGLEVELAESGDAALTCVSRLPDVVIADVVMDGISGYELCRNLRGIGHAASSREACGWARSAPLSASSRRSVSAGSWRACCSASARPTPSPSRALAIVLGVVVVATIVPAWRASRTNPLHALRHQ
jgi:hypothetical protein